MLMLHNTPIRMGLFFLAIATTISLHACAPATQAEKSSPVGPPAGKIVADGSSTVYLVSRNTPCS